MSNNANAEPSEAELWSKLDSQRAIIADVLGYLVDTAPDDDRVASVFCMLRDSFSDLQESIDRIRYRSPKAAPAES